MSTFDAVRPRPAGIGVAILIALAATVLVCLPFTDGPWVLAGLLLAAATIVIAGLAFWVAVPPVVVVLVPALIAAPMMVYTYAWELALYGLAAVMLVHAVRKGAAWPWRLGVLEVALLAFTAWALFSYFWISDLRVYLIGMRRVLLGVVALWVATRLPWIAPRRWFHFGLIAGAAALALTALGRSMTTGLSAEQALLRRTEATNLGWGTANYIATLLLLFTPSVLWLALRGPRLERVLAWLAFGLIAAVQLLVASRAAMALFLVLTMVQLLATAARRHRWWVGLGTAAAITGLLVSPLGSGFLLRFVSLRELGSLTIRLWYFRESWRRLLEHLPWGLGLSQGYANADRLKGIDPHNYWLVVGGDHGLPGLVLWAIVLAVMVRALWALRRNPANRELVFVLLLTFVVANVHTLVEPTFQGTQYQFLWFWLFGGWLAYGAAATPAAESSSSRR